MRAKARDGRAFVDALSRATGAPVAASQGSRRCPGARRLVAAGDHFWYARNSRAAHAGSCGKLRRGSGGLYNSLPLMPAGRFRLQFYYLVVNVAGTNTIVGQFFIPPSSFANLLIVPISVARTVDN